MYITVVSSTSTSFYITAMSQKKHKECARPASSLQQDDDDDVELTDADRKRLHRRMSDTDKRKVRYINKELKRALKERAECDASNRKVVYRCAYNIAIWTSDRDDVYMPYFREEREKSQ
jgi:hypothetical protein